MEQTEKKKMKLFRDPFASEKCDECGTKYQAGKPACPHCGKENPRPNRAIPFDETRMMSPGIELAILLIGWPGLQLVAETIRIIIANTVPNYQYALLLLNYSTYFIIFAAIIGVSFKYLSKLFGKFFTKNTLFGFLVFGAIYLFDLEWSNVTNALGATTNLNQSAVVSMIKDAPILAIVFTGLIAPFCEEMTYRAGVFTFAKRANRLLAYVIVSVVFGMIHMHDFASLNEWLNLPPYIFAGLAFSFAYEKWGLGASTVAHVTNNLFAVIATLLV